MRESWYAVVGSLTGQRHAISKHDDPKMAIVAARKSFYGLKQRWTIEVVQQPENIVIWSVEPD